MMIQKIKYSIERELTQKKAFGDTYRLKSECGSHFKGSFLNF